MRYTILLIYNIWRQGDSMQYNTSCLETSTLSFFWKFYIFSFKKESQQLATWNEVSIHTNAMSSRPSGADIPKSQITGPIKVYVLQRLKSNPFVIMQLLMMMAG